MSSSNQRPANGGFRSVFRCAISHYRQVPSLSVPEPMMTVSIVSQPCYNLSRSDVLEFRTCQRTFEESVASTGLASPAVPSEMSSA